MASKINLPNRLKMLDRINQLNIIHCDPCDKPRKGDMVPCRSCPIYKGIRKYGRRAGYHNGTNKKPLENYYQGPWTIEDVDYLNQAYGKVSIGEISQKLNRSKPSIYAKVSKMRRLSKCPQ